MAQELQIFSYWHSHRWFPPPLFKLKALHSIKRHNYFPPLPSSRPTPFLSFPLPSIPLSSFPPLPSSLLMPCFQVGTFGDLGELQQLVPRMGGHSSTLDFKVETSQRQRRELLTWMLKVREGSLARVQGGQEEACCSGVILLAIFHAEGKASCILLMLGIKPNLAGGLGLHWAAHRLSSLVPHLTARLHLLYIGSRPLQVACPSPIAVGGGEGGNHHP